METELIKAITEGLAGLFNFGGSIVTQVGNANTVKQQQGIAENQQTTAYVTAMAQMSAADAQKEKQKTTIIAVAVVAVVIVVIAALFLTRKKN